LWRDHPPPAAGDLSLHVTWVVLGAAGRPGTEAVSAAAAFLKDVEQTTLVLKAFRDGVLSLGGAEVKEVFEGLKGAVRSRPRHRPLP
jgi:hypothetical protein